MPRQRHQQLQQRSSGRAANRTWAGTVSPVGTSVAAATKVLVATFSLSNPGIDETVLRTRGGVSILPNTVVADAQMSGAWGMCVVTDLAVAAGAASIPGPVTNASDDVWFVWEPLLLNVEFGTTAGVRPLDRYFPFDSKAKRIVQEGRQIAVMVENSSATTAFSFSAAFRMLSMVRGT